MTGASSKLDRATRASPEPASGLGHSASVPSAFDWLIHPVVRLVRNSLDRSPADWSPCYIDGELFHLTHKSGVDVWTQNRPYALEICGPGQRNIWGGFRFPGLGVSAFSLWLAIRRWERRQPLRAKPGAQNVAELLGERL